MEDNLISVVIPVYNTERYLAACLDSVLSQSYHNLEVIVIDDGSTDFSLNIAEKYAEKDDRVKVYPHQNEGLSSARNHGLDVATGSYVTFVDADDLLLPDALEIMHEILKDSNADIIQGDYVRGGVYKVIDHKARMERRQFTPLEAIENTLYQKKILPSACGKLYKRSLFDNLRFEKGILYEDLDIFYKVIERSKKIVWIDFPVYFYRITEGSILNTWKVKRLDVLKITEKIEEYIQEKYPELLPAAKDRRLCANFNMYALCHINGDRENASKCWQHIKKNRNQSLFNPKVRLKNKAGILLSYLGKPLFNIAARKIYK